MAHSGDNIEGATLEEAQNNEEDAPTSEMKKESNPEKGVEAAAASDEKNEGGVALNESSPKDYDSNVVENDGKPMSGTSDEPKPTGTADDDANLTMDLSKDTIEGATLAEAQNNEEDVPTGELKKESNPEKSVEAASSDEKNEGDVALDESPKDDDSNVVENDGKPTTSAMKEELNIEDGVEGTSSDKEEIEENVEATVSGEAKKDEDSDDFTEDSNLKDPQRRICVVTTAALPWRTGTAVNPLLRALYLTRNRPKHHITLVIPWLEEKEVQENVYGQSFSERGEQEEWIRTYARDRAKCATEEEALKIVFYKAAYHKSFGSIFPVEDICNLIPIDEADIAILEEPEHLNWFRVPSPIPSPVRAMAKQLSSESSDQKADENKEGNSNEENSDQLQRDKAELGWKYRFRHVVGILHTNYSAYMKQYGVGTSLIAAPALDILSSIVVKAYCHRVIRLSDVLPSLAKEKEVTCNVHGVRAEFLLPATAESQSENDAETETTPATVYFIGKIIWAKGFDKLLKIQDLYRRATGDYFQMDVYGAGADEKAITRAFFGRNSPHSRSSSQASGDDTPSEESVTDTDALAADVFNTTESLRARVYAAESDRNLQQYGFEATLDDGTSNGGKKHSGPLSILGDFSGKSIGTAVATSNAVYKLADAVVCHGMSMALTWDDDDELRESKTIKKKPSYIFDPPQSLHEWRRNPIPARFLGVKDHALLRNIAEHKIFLNPSVTEVLCTTTAEALSMGKFVIIPKHPSNEFFLQFPNCLAYKTPEECVEKLRWAISREPEPLSPEYARRFTWEAATERLFEASGITKSEMKEREAHGMGIRGNTPLARLHVEFGKKGQFIGNLFSGDNGKNSEDEDKTPPIDRSVETN